MDILKSIEASFRDAGLSAFGLVGAAALRGACSFLSPEERERYGIDRAAGAVIAALSYGEGLAYGEGPTSQASRTGPLARLARFARANWYAELGSRLKEAASRLRGNLEKNGLDPDPSKEWRYFVNSRLPERRLAVESGLGEKGRHGLVMLPGPGSAAVLGLLLLPSRFAAASAPEFSAPQPALSEFCTDCEACVEACPTGALRGDGTLNRELCLQNWSSLPGPLPPAIEAAWGDRLYGCDTCQEACPRYRPDPSAATLRGLLGPGLPASWLAQAPEGEIRAALRGTILGRRWIAIDALRRNARLALRG